MSDLLTDAQARRVSALFARYGEGVHADPRGGRPRGAGRLCAIGRAGDGDLL